MNLILHLKSKFNNSLVSIALTPAEISYFKTLLQLGKPLSVNYGVIYQIQCEFNAIIKEDVISLQEIPNLVLAVTNILKTNIIQNSVQNIGIINVVQFMLNNLFETNTVSINKTEVEIIKSLVDSSLILLKTNVDFVVKEEEVICGFFQGCSCSNLEGECYKFLEYYSL